MTSFGAELSKDLRGSGAIYSQNTPVILICQPNSVRGFAFLDQEGRGSEDPPLMTGF